ncbi:MAG: zf-HC2 domain-containing protein [Candidatus Omnitrophica bacterium]|nr:zf-HC2 domain-containing protein [Candidatus Omnitrophota bacterium]
MKCKQIRDLILTDYIDNEADKNILSSVESHFASCRECKEFYMAVKETIDRPLRESVDLAPSEKVWMNIKRSIEERTCADTENVTEGLDIFGFLRNIKWIIKPAYALAAMLLIFTVGEIKYYNVKEAGLNNEFIQENINYLLGVNANEEENGAEGFGTGIEEYFL